VTGAIATVVSLAALPAVVELARRRRLLPGGEIPRKTVHVGAALLAIPLPFVFSFRAIALLGVAFAAAFAVARRRAVLSAIQDVDRWSYGEILFPLGLAAAAILFPSRHLFLYGLLVVGLADGLAAPVGLRFGRRRLPGGKTAWGSATFFVLAVCVGAVVLAFGGHGAATVASVAVAAAACLTVAESLLSRGFDNLALPALAAALVQVLA
jgi:phytol kinase